MNWAFGIIFGIFVIVTSNIAFAETSDYCNVSNGETVCEIIIFSNKYPLPDYTPDVAEIPIGSKIIFKNDGFIVHTATSTDASPDDNTHLADKGINGFFNTGKLLASEIAEPIILQDEGVYHYFCTVHKEMRGTIVIIDQNVKNDIIIQNELLIPQWIRNNAGWWAEGLISDDDFVSGVEYMISKKIFTIPESSQISENISNEIPTWIKNNAGWWSAKQISDSEFVLSIQHLIKTKIIQIGQSVDNQTLEKLPATSSTIVNFYVNDDDLNTSHNGIDEITTDGLVIATVNDQIISIPKTMTETEPDSGRFYLRIELPEFINGKPLDQDDVIKVTYFDQSDFSGSQRTVVSSTTLSKSFAKIETQGNNQRIGHGFILRIYEPDANRDSKNEDKIPLSSLQFRAEGGIRIPLSKSTFDANSSYLIETGPNSNIFEVEMTIPRTINGKTIHIGDWYEIRYVDSSTPSNTGEKIIFKGKIGIK